MSEFSDFINAQLNRRGWSGAEFSRQMRRHDHRAASTSAVNAWRRDEYLPKREHMPSIARTLDTPEQDIWRMVQPAIMGNLTVGEILARELPPTMTPQEVRLVTYLLRANIQAMQAWGKEEDARAATQESFRMSQSSDEDDASAARR